MYSLGALLVHAEPVITGTACKLGKLVYRCKQILKYTIKMYD